MLISLLPPALQHRWERWSERKTLEAGNAKRKRQLKKESVEYWKKIKDVLIRMGYRHELPERKKPGVLAALITGKRGFQVVRTDHINLREDTISYHVDASKLPWNTSGTGLLEEAIARELSVACFRRVVVEQTEDNYQLWITVWRDDSIAGLPRLYRFKEAFQTLPKKVHPLTFCVGIGEGRVAYWDDLHHIMSLMIAGTIGSGKSVFLNQLIITLGLRNPPSRLHLILCDFKGGIELTFYKKLPHVREFIKELRDVAPKIEELHGVLDTRYAMFADQDVNIDEYNRRQFKPEDKLPYIIMIIDEFADLALGLQGKERARTMNMLIRLFQKGRACGIYFVLATQSPTKEVMEKLIKNNIPTRMAFNCSNVHHSTGIIGNGAAWNLGVRGRAIWASQGVQTLVQAPVLRKAEKMKLIKRIMTKWAEQGEALKINYEEILRYGLYNLNGALYRDRLFEAFKKTNITKHGLDKWLKSIEGQIVMIDGKGYWVFKSENPREPRRLTPAETLSDVPAQLDAISETPHEFVARRSSDVFLKGNGDIQHG